MNSLRVVVTCKTESVITIEPAMIRMTSCVSFMKNCLHDISFFIFLQTVLLLLSYYCVALLYFLQLLQHYTTNLLHSEEKPEHFSSLSAGCASQQKLNRITMLTTQSNNSSILNLQCYKNYTT